MAKSGDSTPSEVRELRQELVKFVLTETRRSARRGDALSADVASMIRDGVRDAVAAELRVYAEKELPRQLGDKVRQGVSDALKGQARSSDAAHLLPAADQPGPRILAEGTAHRPELPIRWAGLLDLLRAWAVPLLIGVAVGGAAGLGAPRLFGGAAADEQVQAADQEDDVGAAEREREAGGQDDQAGGAPDGADEASVDAETEAGGSADDRSAATGQSDFF